MQDKWIITRLSYNMEAVLKELGGKEREGSFVLIAHFMDSKAVEMYVEEDLEEGQASSRLGNLYIGKVAKVVKNIGAAFIEIEDGQMCYYSLKDSQKAVYTKEKKGRELVAGDELIVQLTKDGMKTKEPVVSSELNFSGRYVVLVHGKEAIGVSSKIPANEKERFRGLLQPFLGDDYGFIVRTNAQTVREEEILAEADALVEEYKAILKQAKHRTACSCLKSNPPMYCRKLQDILFLEETKLVTDDTEILETMKAYLAEQMPEVSDRLVFYEDSLLPLYKLYSLEKILSDALRERVWLKSGGYLIIQPTEALTVIDVNSGKFDGKKKKEETFFKINSEAAVEIARQLRLRNLSGIILVDFINLEQEAHVQRLLQLFREEIRKDSVKTTLVDITGLGLVELTRKKEQRPLHEQLRKRG